MIRWMSGLKISRKVLRESESEFLMLCFERRGGCRGEGGKPNETGHPELVSCAEKRSSRNIKFEWVHAESG